MPSPCQWKRVLLFNRTRMSKVKKKKGLPDWCGSVYDAEKEKEAAETKYVYKSKPYSYPKPNTDSGNSNSVSDTAKTKGEKTPIDQLISDSMPYLEYNGSIVYCCNEDDCCLLCDDIMELVESENELVVGFDLEWPVTYEIGNPSGKVALVQISVSEETCYLFHIAAMKEFPHILKMLIEDKSIKKVGLNIENDFWKLDKDWDVNALSIIRHSKIELRHLANEKLKSNENWSLDGLVRNVFRQKLNKDVGVRCGDWAKFPLTSEQQKYAAIDSYASLKLYNVLNSMK